MTTGFGYSGLSGHPAGPVLRMQLPALAAVFGEAIGVDG